MNPDSRLTLRSGPIRAQRLKLAVSHTGLSVLAVLVLTLPALWPLLRPGFFVSDDGLFHVYRIAALTDAWRHGVLYPRLFPEFGFGYGQAVLNFYAPLTYWPAALLGLLGVGPAAAAQVTIALGFLLAALAAFGLGRRLWGPPGGILAAVAYTYFPYHLADAYVRGAIPEHFAFIWPPFILWAYTTAFGAGRAGPDDARPRPGSAPAFLWAALAWAGLVYTHNLTALMFAPVAAAYLLVLAAWTRRWRLLWPAAGSLALAVALSAPLWLPFLAESGSVGIALGPSDGYVRHLAPPARAVQWLPFYRYRLEQGGAADHPIGWPAVVLLVAVAALVIARAAAGRRAVTQRALHVGENLGSGGRSHGAASGAGAGAPAVPALFGLALLLGAGFMITAPALGVWRAFQPVLAQLQYPWRFLALAALGAALLAAALPSLLPQGSRAPLAGLAGLVMLVTALPYVPVQPLALPDAETRAPDRMWREDAAAGQVGATWTGEFLPLTVREQRWALGRAPEKPADGLPPAALPQVRLEQVSYAGAVLAIDGPAATTARLHQFYLPGWNASLDGAPAPAYASGEMGLVTVDVPAGAHRVAFEFGPTPARTAGFVLGSLAALAWAALAMLTWRRGRSAEVQAAAQQGALGAAPAPLSAPRARREAVGLLPAAVTLVALALLLGLNRFGVGRQAWTPRPAQAALADVALLVGYDAAQAPGQNALDVTLYWFALRDVAAGYKSFVHLTGPDGGVLAQHDGDPAGGFTPTSRWRPGELIADRHTLPLPAGLTGEYGLKAGLYQSEPMHNLQVSPPAADDRVDLGTLRLPGARP